MAIARKSRRRAVLLSLALACGLGGAALAQQQTQTCIPGQAVNTPLVDLDLAIDTIALQNDMSDPGGSFELSLRVLPVVYQVDGQGRPGAQICAPGPVLFKTDLPKLNAWTGQTSDFRVAFNHKLVGVPGDAMVRYAIAMNEEDSSSGDDLADLSPLSSARELTLDAYPRNLRGLVEPDAPAGPFDTFDFARHKRIIADGRGPGVDFLAGLSFTLTRVGAGAPTPPPAQPKALNATQKRCMGYALGAIQHQITNKAMGCGFAGRDWDSQAQAHYDWCMSGVDAAVTQNEQQRRGSLLIDQCSQGNKAVLTQARFKACLSYASHAAIQALEARILGCGGQPPVWNTEAAGHYLWCMEGINDQFIQTETQKRITALQACRN